MKSRYRTLENENEIVAISYRFNTKYSISRSCSDVSKLYRLWNIYYRYNGIVVLALSIIDNW